MTVVAAEAIPAVESAAPAAASSGGVSAAARTGGRTSQGRGPKPSPQPRGSFRPSTQSPPSQSGGGPRSGGRTQQGASQPARTGGRTQQGTQGGKRVKPGQPVAVSATDDEGRTIVLPDASVPEHTWHRWIMAEFVLAVILVGASPFLKPGGPAAKAPSFAAPLVRLTAVSLIYFILALMAQGPRSGKIAAAFGGLVLLGTAFNSLPEFTTLGQAFGSSGPPGTQTGLKAGETDETGGGSGGREVPQ